MSSSDDETRTITDWRTASKLYRRPPGLVWLVALIAVPLLLGLIGWGATDRSGDDADLTLPAVNPSATLSAPGENAPGSAASDTNAPNNNAVDLNFAPLSVVRNGNDITLTGDLPDDAAKTALLDSLRAQFGPDVNLIDNLSVKSGVRTPDVNGLGAVFGAAAAGIPDFDFNFDGDTVTLNGTAATEEAKAAVEAAVRAAWPNIRITNNIRVSP
ncbi:BON domain-containing protein [Mycobacterium sp. 21AC1]|uniref:channel-forming protein ArfA/OmpATb n=1 Tax=[Mycobacterium] appelbergii TaxID=2939269 RepID=UPI002938E1BF|nr:BON domain-containing protein [Mycobacterium sp. 21AC1]MDV3129810.1 BON domain-containing protein [Mycobacterium sp. 21AC1]